MAKLKNPLFSFISRGRLGNVTYLRRRNTDIAEKTPRPKDVKSISQLSWRHMYQKAIALWHALSASEKQEWEALGTARHMTGFAYFISSALKPNPGLYLPLQGGTMQGDIDMAGFKIEDLPDPAADQEPVTRKYFDDNLPIGGYTEGARVYHDANQSIPHDTHTTLAFNSETYDTDEIHDPVTNNSRLTAKTAGYYVIIGHFHFDLNVTGARWARIYLNGDTEIARITEIPMSTTRKTLLASTIIHLAVNQYVTLLAYQSSGGALNVDQAGIWSPSFMMQRVG